MLRIVWRSGRQLPPAECVAFTSIRRRTTRAQTAPTNHGTAQLNDAANVPPPRATTTARRAGRSAGTVMLPISPVYQVDASGGRVHPGARDLLPPHDSADRLDGLRILAVDDEADTRELLRKGLEYCGANVQVVGSASEAIEALMSSVPDILISDIGMPGTDGFDLIRQVRALPPDRGSKVAAIALTAYTRIEDRLQALRAGYDMHVPKPVELAELCAVAASVVRRNA